MEAHCSALNPQRTQPNTCSPQRTVLFVHKFDSLFSPCEQMARRHIHPSSDARPQELERRFVFVRAAHAFLANFAKQKIHCFFFKFNSLLFLFFFFDQMFPRWKPPSSLLSSLYCNHTSLLPFLRMTTAFSFSRVDKHMIEGLKTLEREGEIHFKISGLASDAPLRLPGVRRR